MLWGVCLPQVGLCTSLQPLLPLQKLQCLIVTGKKGSGGDAFAVASQDLVQLRALTQLRWVVLWQWCGVHVA